MAEQSLAFYHDFMAQLASPSFFNKTSHLLSLAEIKDLLFFIMFRNSDRL
jgi:NAD-dependent SIR2 family protein deacetylase